MCRFSVASIALHCLIIAFILFMSASAAHKVAAEKPMRAFLASAAPPPPPPPPPPPAASSHQATPKPTIKPVDIPRPTFVQPTEIPKELPKIDVSANKTPDVAPSQSSSEPAGEPGGVPGGVVGGVVGGVQGGVVGGTVGGQLGGVLGGEKGGTGTGEAKEPEPPPKPEGPLRVGGDVKAPVVTHRAEPQYTDVARKARIQGVVIVEAIIDKDGNVDKVRVIKGLPMGLSEEAEDAVRKWRFRPGTLNGEPVDVIFNLTVNFTLQ